MRQNPLFRRLLALVLAAAMLLGAGLSAGVSAEEGRLTLELEQIDNSVVTAQTPAQRMTAASDGTDTSELEMVRVSIELDTAPAIGAGFDWQGIGRSDGAIAYRQSLQRQQVQLQRAIEEQVLRGEKLDVVWNLTLAANVISANVPRGAIDQIAAMDGVRSVSVETRYTPDVVSIGGTYEPNMAVSGQMTGASQVWESGYTGAGSLIAVIDTGLDTDHQSFDAGAYDYAISQIEAEKGMEVAQMDAADIEAVLTQLNAWKRVDQHGGTLTAEDLYINSKTAFGYNYIDGDLDVTHDNDAQGEHGSHAAGIATANRYINKDGEFVDALSSVYVAGAAPDAQILVMKVFGKDGGAYDSDIMAAIEDAMILGADAVNLSLGSATAGNAAVENETYRQLLERVADSGVVLAASAGNDGHWAASTTAGYLYSDGVNFDTVGTPASYAAMLAIASVDNDGVISPSLVAGGKSMGYTESLTDAAGLAFGNTAISALDTSADGSGTDYEFVLIDGVGAVEDYAGIDLTGKIAICSRGELYYAEKANNAASLGAAALIVYNTEPGTVYMDLTDYSYTMPAVFVTRANGAAIRAAATGQASRNGGSYYTGTITVRSALSGNYENSEFKTMSSFSSWGVPGDLSLKPEITAPGGSIYSVNGAVAETDQYELMSGTSMSAPQVSGLTALVKQYLHEQGIESDVLGERALTQSLLMSTAEPMMEQTSGSYYAVFQQGSGLANAAAAVQTPVYVTVEGMADGRVKAELGDDPDRTGAYSFTFTLHNFSDSDHTYALGAALFTQGILTDTEGVDYLDTRTRAMDAEVGFRPLDGALLPASDGLKAEWDFDGDGTVTREDAMVLLRHVTLGEGLAANADDADISGDGAVTTYDAHLLLRGFDSSVVVPANGSITITVTMTLTDGEKARLAQENPIGAYVEAYVFARPVTSADGALLPELSIPVLGYYGNWTDPGMFDVGTQVTHATGDESRDSYVGNTYGNAVGIVYGDRPTEVWYFGGNPIVPDETYIPGRNAINVARGDRFSEWSYAPVRNAAASRFTMVNTTTGEVLADRIGGAVEAAFYYALYASWMNTPQYYTIDLRPELEEGESAMMTLSLAPEYYVNSGGSVEWDALGDGATLEMPFTVDNEYPEIHSVTVDEEAQIMYVTASDDQYLAGVLLYDVTGRDLLEYVGTTADAQAGDTITFEIPLDTVDGYKFIIQTADYACNMVTYELRQTIGTPDPLPTRLAFDESFNSWSTFYNGSYGWNSDEWFESDLTIVSATAIGETVLACDAGGNLYAIPVEDMLDGIFIRRLGVVLTDMTYVPSTGQVYGVSEDGVLYNVDKYSGAVREVGTIGVSTNTLAADPGGTFYCTHYRQEGYDWHFEVYTFTLETIASPTLLGDVYQNYYYEPSGVSALEYNPTTQTLGWLARVPGYSFDESYYFEIDPRTGDSLLSYSHTPPTPFTKGAVALVYPTWGAAGNAWTNPTDDPASVVFDKAEVEILRGYSAELGVNVYPWTLTDRSVTFTSSDETVAAVGENGVVTGIRPGTVTITAASTLDPSVSTSCTVTVRELEITVEGILRDEIGTPMFYTWDLTGDAYVRGETIDTPAMAVTQRPEGDSFYLLDSDEGTMHLLDRQGNDLAEPSNWFATSNYWIWDMAYSGFFSTGEADMVYGIRENQLLAPFDPMSPEMVSFDLSMYGVTNLTGVAAGGTETITYQDYYGETHTVDSEILYMIDDQNRVWRCNMFLELGVRYNMVFSVIPTDLDVAYPAEFSGRSALVVGSDGALYYSAWTGSTNELYRLTYDEGTESYEVTRLGDFGRDVWPVTILEAVSNAEEAAAPAGTTRFVSAPVGSLDAAVDVADQQTDGIVYDYRSGTVTIPVVAENSTNGLFELRYDPEVLTLQEPTGGLAAQRTLKCADTATPGIVRMGYANSIQFSGLLAQLTFAYTGTEPTGITLTTLEDGAAAPGSVQTVELKAPVNPFVDVNDGDFFFDPVLWAVEEGITNGVDGTHFGPAKACTRAEAVTFLWRAAGCPEPESGENPFVDVSGSDFFCKAVLWAVENGVTNGVDASHFAPYSICNRAQTVTFLWRYFGSEVPNGGSDPFTDVEEDQWYTDAIGWAVERGVTDGMGDGTFGINLPCNRAHIVTFLYRSFGN